MGASASALFTRLPIDWVILGIVIVVVAVDATRNGTARAAALALSLPLAALFYSYLPQTAVLGTFAAPLSRPIEQIAILALFFVILFFLMYRVASRSFGGVGIVPGIIAGAACAVVLGVVWLEVPALFTLWHPGQTAQALFAAQYRFWWLLGAYVALAGARS